MAQNRWYVIVPPRLSGKEVRGWLPSTSPDRPTHGPKGVQAGSDRWRTWPYRVQRATAICASQTHVVCEWLADKKLRNGSPVTICKI
jgi:hypothetical protein